MANTINRRSLLRASPALLGSGLLASPVLAHLPQTEEDPRSPTPSADTPVLRLFREWDGVQADMGTCADEQVDALFDTGSSLEKRILAEPSIGPLDLAAKVIASSCYGDFKVGDEVIRESEQVLGVSRPAGTAAHVAPIASAGEDPTPVMALYREHQALTARFNEARDDTDGQPLYDELLGLEHRMTATPARTLADLAAKVLVLTQIREGGDTIFEPDLAVECEAFVAGALA